MGTTESKAQYWLALARLQQGNVDGYRKICAEALLAADPATDIDAANKAVWACVVVPNQFLGLIDPLVAKAEQVVDEAKRQKGHSASTSILHRSLNTLGAAYCRAEMYDKAVTALSESEDEYNKLLAADRPAAARRRDEGKVWNWLFLAMAHHQLGNAAEARSFRDKFMEELEQDNPQQLAKVTGVPALSWDQRIVLDRLNEEALNIVSANDGDDSDAQKLR